MPESSTYQLPGDIQMPSPYRRYPCYQIWFYDGVQTALDRLQPLDDFELRRDKGARVADAYRAGFEAGKRYRATNHLDSPELTPLGRLAQKPRQKTWFTTGVEDFLSGRQPMDDTRLRSRYGDGAANEYRAGFEAAKIG
jgi:hypothetical protein